MLGNPIVDHAIVDALHPLLEGIRDVHLVGALSQGAGERLAWTLGARLSTGDRPDLSRARHEMVVVLEMPPLDEAQAVVSPGGTLTVAAINPCHGSFLLELLEGNRPPRPEPCLDGVRDRLEADGWEVADATPVAVPLALLPFDPARIPKTVLAYLYARHPDLETYCYLLRARRALVRPPRPRPAVRQAPADFPTTPWKTEGEWREEARRCAPAAGDSLSRPGIDAGPRAEEGAVRMLDDAWRMVEALRLDLTRRDEELSLIKSSLTWRAIVRYRTARERLLPPLTRRGRAYERARSAVRRLVLGGDRHRSRGSAGDMTSPE